MSAVFDCFQPAFKFFFMMVLCCWGPALSAEELADLSQTLPWVRCLDLALKFNPEVLQRKAKVEEVEGAIITQRAHFLPAVTMGGVTTDPMVTVGVAVPIYTRARDPAFAAFPSARKAAWANLQLAILEMAYQLRLAYILAYYDQELVPVAQQELDLLKNRVSRAPSLFTAGKLTKADLESLDVRQALSESKLETARNQAEKSRLTLLQIVGLLPGDPQLQGKLVTDFKAFPTQENNPAKLIALALAQRQDLELLRNLQKVDEALVLVNAAGYYPVLGAGAIITNDFQPPGVTNSIYKTLDPRKLQQNGAVENLRGTTANFEMVANWRVYDGGVTKGNVVEAKADVMKQEILIQQIKDQIPRQVYLAVSIINSTEKLILDLTTNGNAEKNLTNLQQVYEAGQVSQVEVLDAQDEYILYKEDMLRLQSGHDQALAALDRLVGQTFRVEITIP